jgi:hypothetical protein
MIEVVVEEDWRSTVARIPIMRAAIGLVSSPSKAPAVHPPITLAALPMSSSEKRKK